MQCRKYTTLRGRYELPPVADVKYTAFVDPSGGAQDSMTLAVAFGEKGRAVLACVREARPPFSPEAVVADFVKMLEAYRVTKVSGDRWGGEASERHGYRLGHT
jgi:hypothetical protein